MLALCADISTAELYCEGIVSPLSPACHCHTTRRLKDKPLYLINDYSGPDWPHQLILHFLVSSFPFDSGGVVLF